MTVLPDTSFLFSLYLWRETSEKASEAVGKLKVPLTLTPLVRYEFESAVRLMVFRHERDHRTGVPLTRALAILGNLELDLENGLLQSVTLNWEVVLRVAAVLSETWSAKLGTRAFDTLHVAAAVHLGADQFLTFDQAQRELAAAEGLQTDF